MKKWIAIILAMVMAFGLTATVMADGLTLDEKTTSQKAKFSIVIPSTFTWSIPEFGSEVGTESIIAGGSLQFWDLYVPGDAGDIAVTITSKNGNCFKDELGNELPYTLTAPNQVSGKDSYYLVFGSNDIKNALMGICRMCFDVTLKASRDGHYTAGTFSDQLTFTAQTMNRTTEKLTNVGGTWTYAG